MNDAQLAIDVRGLVKAFDGHPVVNGIDIQMPKGQVWGFLGPNGSGKTTTIRMICGLLKPTAGTGLFLGHDIITEAEIIKRSTGYMTQKFSFWADLSIRQNLEFVARLYNQPNTRVLVDETLDALGLTHRQNQLAGALSGGWKQRLALAAVTMHRPQLLLLDEPTAGVDPQARRDFWDQIHRFSDQGMTILVSTHYMDEAERCDQIVYLAHGELITQGTVKDVISQSGLKTFKGSGPQVRQMATWLKGQAGIEHVAYFGNALHVSSTDPAALAAAIQRSAQQAADIKWQAVEPSLEDTFIALMAQSGADQRTHG
ncbi:ABC transporter ATP-binding protein [Marinicella meishanensis]|uniref:ABC transporter ATP-binding protein n=1 Tax=Marinicella meishanensis TaxID=2873263 RepID=UPI001CBCFEAF|nr:ABC transporter ATP-binding protein [Marinicella sp. NBU2979]